MRKFIYIISLSVLLIGCKEDEIQYQAPEVKIKSPSKENASINWGEFFLTVELKADQIEKLEVFVDDKIFKTSKPSAEVLNISMHTKEIGTGNHTLKVILYTNLGITEDKVEINIKEGELKIDYVTVNVIDNTSIDLIIHIEDSAGNNVVEKGVYLSKDKNIPYESFPHQYLAKEEVVHVTNLDTSEIYYYYGYVDTELSRVTTLVATVFAYNHGVFTDERDGNQYNWVEINGTKWMSDNFAYLPYVNQFTEEFNCFTENSRIYVYGYQGNEISEAKNSTNYVSKGALYTFKAFEEFIPEGCRYPTESDYLNLFNYIKSLDLTSNAITNANLFRNKDYSGNETPGLFGFNIIRDAGSVECEQRFTKYYTRYWCMKKDWWYFKGVAHTDIISGTTEGGIHGEAYYVRYILK